MVRHLAQHILVSSLLKTPLQLPKPLYLKRCLFLGISDRQKKLSHESFEIFDHTCEIKNYHDYEINYKPVTYLVVQTLQNLLNITTYQTNKIIATYPQFKKRSRINILNNFYNLLEAGIQKSTIEKNIWLLAHDDNKLKEKLNCINTLDMSNEELVPLLRFTQNELMNNINYIKSDTVPYTYNKIEYLAHRLECSIEEFCKLTVLYSFILKIPVLYIDKKLNVLHEYNISNKNILEDLRVLRCNEDRIRHKCEMYKNIKDAEMKICAIKSPFRVMTRTVQKNDDTKYHFVQDYNNISEYLSNKLNVKKADLKILTTKWPNILQMNRKKLDSLITILHENGITSNEITEKGGPILCQNVETVHKRAKILNEKNMPVKISTLRMSQKLFERTVQENDDAKRNFPENNINKYLFNKLNGEKVDLEISTTKWPSILQKNPRKLDNLITILHQNGITGNEIIRKGGSIFYHNVETIRKRAKILNEKNIPVKMSTLRLSQKLFERYIEIFNNKHELRQFCQNNKKYLMDKLNADEETIENFLRRWPIAINMNVQKLEKLFEMLYQYGITNDTIKEHGSIVYHNIDTLRKRLEILKEAGITPMINMILYNKKQFNNFVKLHRVIK